MVEASSCLTKLLLIHQFFGGQYFFQLGFSWVQDTMNSTLASFYVGTLGTEMWLKNKTTAYSINFGLVAALALTAVNVLECIFPSIIMTTVLPNFLVGVHMHTTSKSLGIVRTAIKGRILGFQINQVAAMLYPLLSVIIAEYFTMVKPNAKLLSTITTFHSVLFASMLLYQYDLSSSGFYTQEIDAIAEELTAESENSKRADSEKASKSEQLSESVHAERKKDIWGEIGTSVLGFIGLIIPLIKLVMVARS